MMHNLNFYIYFLLQMCELNYQCSGYEYSHPDEEKGCSARDLVKYGSCRAENLLSNDIKCEQPRGKGTPGYWDLIFYYQYLRRYEQLNEK